MREGREGGEGGEGESNMQIDYEYRTMYYETTCAAKRM